MEKIEEMKVFEKFVKYYKTGEEISVFDLINQLKQNGVEIEKITIKEDVESDLQTISGASYTESELISNFNYISTHMIDGSYKIAAIFNGEKISVTVYDLKPYIILSSTDENLELDNLLSEKKNNIHL